MGPFIILAPLGGRDSVVGMATCCKVVRPRFKPVVAHDISYGRSGLVLFYDKSEGLNLLLHVI